MMRTWYSNEYNGEKKCRMISLFRLFVVGGGVVLQACNAIAEL